MIVLDLLAPRQPTLAGLAQPILDEVHPELNWNTHARAKGTFTAEGLTPAAQGSFTSEVTRQDAKFPVPAKGRYLCLESLNTHDSAGVTAVAELDAFGPDGRDLPKSNWKILWCEQRGKQRRGRQRGKCDQPASPPTFGTPRIAATGRRFRTGWCSISGRKPSWVASAICRVRADRISRAASRIIVSTSAASLSG